MTHRRLVALDHDLERYGAHLAAVIHEARRLRTQAQCTSTMLAEVRGQHKIMHLLWHCMQQGMGPHCVEGATSVRQHLLRKDYKSNGMTATFGLAP